MTGDLTHLVHDTTVGPLILVGDDTRLRAVWFGEPHSGQDVGEERCREDAPGVLQEAARQLEEYLRGERQTFDLPLALEGTEFQRQVWERLRAIPYGQTRSYGEIAAEIGKPRAAQAVGAANGHNPLSIVVPCHRVIGSDGAITGYAGGIERKQALLDMERRVAGDALF
ncbi:methylated-DNA--[protein]-cysteine S-methyltransferase [Nigerium massiliense]|uniref:methylated-DNA--[protein]-cysteine S-methyltransferase n=1 Tax=Nigerium massiliense TaxID=1522317 RepID=UPI00058EC138|nr:methylated-DNA--[protein]-cysteine S-methyltransferase [Nigerium massiliense]